MKTGFRLTRKTAMELVEREVGVNANKLRRQAAGEGVCTYFMHLGRFLLEVSNDWYTENGRIALCVSSDMGAIWHLYDPKTLEEDITAEEAWRACK